MHEPFDVNKLDEIILFRGQGPTIIFHREGKYIYLEKEGCERTVYRFNLVDGEFERLNFYKTTEDKITKVKAGKITSWFKDCTLVTKDIHFGRLAVFAKYNRVFEKYSSPVRFIEQLGSNVISNIERWESLGFVVNEMEDFFGEFQVRREYSGPVDYRKEIYEGTVPRNHRSLYRGYLSYGPQDFSKSLLKHLLEEYQKIDFTLLRKMKRNYSNGEDLIEEELLKLAENPEFRDCFDYEAENNYRRENRPLRNILMEDRQSFNIRMRLIELIKRYSLDIKSLARWLQRQRNVEKNDITFLIETGHYGDYLRCEFELKEGTRSHMVKYPKNFRTEFHKVQEEYSAKKEEIDKKRFARQCEDYAHFKHDFTKKKTKKKYKNGEESFVVIIPSTPEHINEEAAELKHCVRTYIQPMAEGRTTILFLRKADSPDVPYVTLEVKNNILKQAYGLNDKKPEYKALKFLRWWCKEKDVEPGCWTRELTI